MAFFEQKENNNNDNLCKIHVGLYNTSALICRSSVKANVDFT